MKRYKQAHTHSIDISEKAGIRYLHFGSQWVQGAMRIKKPLDLELAYAQDMMLSLLLTADSGESLLSRTLRILQIGLGAGSLVKWGHRHLPNAHITAVEINPNVYAAARQFFHLPSNDARFEVVIGDGVAFLQDSPGNWDLILLDGYDADGHPGALDSEDFYRLCRDRLSDNGLLVSNLLGLARSYQQSVERISQAFDGYISILPACSSGNRIIFAGRYPIEPTVNKHNKLAQLADTLNTQTGLDLSPLLARINAMTTFPPPSQQGQKEAD